jgi:repressor LexA
MSALLDQLTPRQAAVFEFIREKVQTRGYGPTVREIGSTPHQLAQRVCHLRALKAIVYRANTSGDARAIELAPRSWPKPRGCCHARRRAGLTNLAEQSGASFAQMFSKKSMFALKVKGDSMIEAQIADGDYVVIKKQRTAQPGQMVIAQTPEGEATLKYWHPEAHRIRLQPANSSMPPIYVKEASVLGIVVGVVRNMI